jgi:hypothetical protein
VAPMLNPAADTMSFFLNSTSSYVVPPAWIKWSWKSYLQLPNCLTPCKLPKYVAEDDNAVGWEHSIWRSTTIGQRLLFEPLGNDMKSTCVDTTENVHCPHFIVATNRGDILRDDGIKLVQQIRAQHAFNGTVSHYDFSGSHVTGIFLDKALETEMLHEWAQLMFPKSVEH